MQNQRKAKRIPTLYLISMLWGVSGNTLEVRVSRNIACGLSYIIWWTVAPPPPPPYKWNEGREQYLF